MEDASRQRRIGPAMLDDVGQMLGFAGAAAGHNWNPNGSAHRCSDLQIVAVASAVAIHAGQHNLACTQQLHLPSPCHCLESCGHSAAAHKHLPHLAAVPPHSLGIDIHHGGAAAEPIGYRRHQLGRAHGGRVDAHFFRTGLNELAGILERPDAAPHRERHEDCFRHTPHNVEHDGPAFVAGRDVEKHQLIGPLGFIASRHGHRIAGIDEIQKSCSLDDAALLHIEAWNDAFGEHARSVLSV